jgi:hypothetical protein
MEELLTAETPTPQLILMGQWTVGTLAFRDVPAIPRPAK